MAKTPASPDDIMTVSELKSILRFVKGEAEVGCALGLTDNKEAVVLAHKKDKPKRVRTSLLKKAKEVGLGLNTSGIRFGRATLDPTDEAVLLIRINKGPIEGPLPVAVKKRAKSAGFRNVVFTIDESLETEPEEVGAGSDAPPPQQQTRPPSAEQMRSVMEKLTPSIKAAMASRPELRDVLFSASKSFVNRLQAGDLSEAMRSVEDVVHLLKQAGGGGLGQPAARCDFKAARAQWDDAMGIVDAQLEKLAQKLREAGDPDLAEIAEFGLSAVTNNHRVPLIRALIEVGPGTPETLAKAAPKALAAVRAFRQHIDSDARVEACEANPYDVPVRIRAALGPALAGLEAAFTTKS